jgi:hypothetical protein
MSKYATKLEWGNGRWIVTMYRDAQLVAALSIEDWAALSATKHALEHKPIKARPAPKWLAAGWRAKNQIPKFWGFEMRQCCRI